MVTSVKSQALCGSIFKCLTFGRWYWEIRKFRKDGTSNGIKTNQIFFAFFIQLFLVRKIHTKLVFLWTQKNLEKQTLRNLFFCTILLLVPCNKNLLLAHNWDLPAHKFLFINERVGSDQHNFTNIFSLWSFSLLFRLI